MAMWRSPQQCPASTYAATPTWSTWLACRGPWRRRHRTLCTPTSFLGTGPVRWSHTHKGNRNVHRGGGGCNSLSMLWERPTRCHSDLARTCFVCLGDAMVLSSGLNLSFPMPSYRITTDIRKKCQRKMFHLGHAQWFRLTLTLRTWMGFPFLTLVIKSCTFMHSF
jgi:hypothetical protein